MIEIVLESSNIKNGKLSSLKSGYSIKAAVDPALSLRQSEV